MKCEKIADGADNTKLKKKNQPTVILTYIIVHSVGGKRLK